MTDRHELFTVQARDRVFRFEGRLLSHTSSHQPGKPRWAEVLVYKTVDDDYVVAGVGKSVVKGESDLCWAHVCKTPAAAVEQLHQYDRDDVRYITTVAKDAILQSGDQPLIDAFQVENLTARTS